MPEPNRPLKVFLCYAHADRDLVRGLYVRLTQDGVNAWFDKAKLLPGQDWELEIRKAVREADVVVVCLSKQFNQAGFRQKEVRLALDTAMEKPEGEIFIIPARLDECETLESLRKWHWVDLFEEDGYEMLVRALQARANNIGATLQEKKSWLPTAAAPRKTDVSVVEKKSVETKQDIWDESTKLKAQKLNSFRKPNTAIIVTLIVFIGTIVAGLLGSPLIEKWFLPLPAETELITKAFTVTYEPITPSYTLEPSLTPTETISPINTFIPTPTVVPIIGEWLLDFDWQCDGKDVGHNLIVFYSNGKLVSFMGTSTTVAGRATWKLDGVNITWTYPEITYIGKVTTEEKMDGAMGDGGSCWTAQRTEIADAKGVSMVLVPAGEFIMGTNKGNSIDEQPSHQVYLNTFYIDKYEVTNAQYKACVTLGSCKPLSNKVYYETPKYSDHPVTYVDWYEAGAFCAWREARLPTEAEWEKAASNGKEANYPWGNAIDCSFANYRGINKYCVGDSTPVGSYEYGKSIYGVYDMVGNAMEWVSSKFADYPYIAIDGREDLDSDNPRVIRGGSWNSKESVIRITSRAWMPPSSAEFDFGFRCAKDAIP
jgi:formylglycine-generating enzyme required for sulfatase activity